MKSQSQKIKNLIANSVILSFPGFISIFLSLLSIPIHLKFAGLENFGNYPIQKFSHKTIKSPFLKE